MRVKEPIRGAGVAAALTLGLAACVAGNGGDDADPHNGAEAAGPTGRPGGTYSATLTEPSYLAPASNCYESECSAVLKLVNDPLVSIDTESGELVYDGLAESIRSNQEQTVWTITLKDGRTFHNGEPVNSDAFIRAWNHSANPRNAQFTAGFMSRIEGAGKGEAMSGLKKVDDTTFEVALSGPFAQFGAMMTYAPAFAPIAQECLDDIEACNERPIGTGPYEIDGQWHHDQGITATRWADYEGEQPAQADTIELKMFPTSTAEFHALKNGGVDVIRRLSPDVHLEAKEALGDRMFEAPSTTLTYLGFPVEQEPFDNEQVRQAISLSIDRDLIVDQVLNGLADPAADIPTPSTPGYRDDACGYCQHDPGRAKQLLAESGIHPEKTALIYYFNADAGDAQWVEAVARQVQENLGFRYKLNAIDSAQYLRLLDDQKFTGAFQLGWSPAYPSPENYLRPLLGTGQNSNYTGYSNSEFDEKLTAADRATTIEESIGLYQQAGDIALEDLPILPMWSGAVAIAYSADVGDVRYDVGEREIAFGEITVNQ